MRDCEEEAAFPSTLFLFFPASYELPPRRKLVKPPLRPQIDTK